MKPGKVPFFKTHIFFFYEESEIGLNSKRYLRVWIKLTVALKIIPTILRKNLLGPFEKKRKKDYTEEEDGREKEKDN